MRPGEPSQKSQMKRKRSNKEESINVEQFLAEAHTNLLNLSSPIAVVEPLKRKRSNKEESVHVEQFLAEAHTNFLNLSSPIAVVEPVQKDFVEKFFREAHEAFMRDGNENIEIPHASDATSQRVATPLSFELPEVLGSLDAERNIVSGHKCSGTIKVRRNPERTTRRGNLTHGVGVNLPHKPV